MLSSPLYRLGRKLYTNARLEISENDIVINGEAGLQKKVIDLFSAEPVTVFDIGANVGDWSESFVQQATSCQLTIHAFEPVAHTNTVLKKKLQSYEADNIALVISDLAISDEVNEKMIYMSGSLAGSNSLHDASEFIDSEKVKLTTLDQYCLDHQIDHIHLVKIDIEGHDLFAIEGAKKMLSKERISVLQFEYNHRWIYSRKFLKDVFDFRDSYLPMYQIGKLTGDGIFIYSAWHYELEKFFEGNYLLIHTGLVTSLNCQTVSFDRYNALS